MLRDYLMKSLDVTKGQLSNSVMIAEGMAELVEQFG